MLLSKSWEMARRGCLIRIKFYKTTSSLQWISFRPNPNEESERIRRISVVVDWYLFHFLLTIHHVLTYPFLKNFLLPSWLSSQLFWAKLSSSQNSLICFPFQVCSLLAFRRDVLWLWSCYHHSLRSSLKSLNFYGTIVNGTRKRGTLVLWEI